MLKLFFHHIYSVVIQIQPKATKVMQVTSWKSIFASPTQGIKE